MPLKIKGALKAASCAAICFVDIPVFFVSISLPPVMDYGTDIITNQRKRQVAPEGVFRYLVDQVG